MSSPAPSSQGTHSTTSRNPRRRQRNPAEEGSIRQQQPQRKRHKATGDVFRPGVEREDETTPSHMNGHASPKQDRGESFAPLVEMPVRGKYQQIARRGLKDESTVILTKNANYVVKQLPNLPDNIRLSRRESLRGAFLSSTVYALALTRTQAFVWDYTSASSSPVTRTFTLQHPSRPSEPLPLGSLVTSGAGTETGLVVINTTSGKLTYWESVENAHALSLFEQRRNGITGSCGSLLSGETVVDFEYAEAAGFILRFSSGRTAQLLLRDAQSRPSISVRFLQSQQSNLSSGFFGGLKSVFKGAGWLKNIVAAKAHPSSTRGYTDTILANQDGHFQVWQLSFAGQTLLLREINANAAVTSAAEYAVLGAEDQHSKVTVVDFAIVTRSPTKSAALVVNGTRAENMDCFDLLVLVAVSGDDRIVYALVEVETTGNTATARRTVPLHSYTPPTNFKSEWKPKLCLPGSQDTVFAIFENAIVLISLATIKVSPEVQLLMDEHQLPEPFQDVVYLKDDHRYRIVGVNAEESNATYSESSIIILVENYGLIRIDVEAPASDDQAVERSRISAKSKIEQAVFFGSVAENPLDLFRGSEKFFPLEEVESAALEISREVCATESPHLSTVAPVMEYHLEHSARVLKNLAIYLKQYNGISRIARWKLRWDAERLAAARKVWALYNKSVSGSDPEERLLPRLLLLLDERFKTVVDVEHGERDRVRQWFLKDVWRMENIVPWPWRAIHYLEKENEIRDNAAYFELLSDACDIVLGALETAFDFRTDNAALYNLQDERMTGGVLESGYNELPEFWTSTYPLQKILPVFINGARGKLLEATEGEDGELLEKIAECIPRLIDVFCKGAEERYRWYCARPEAKERAVADEFKQTYETDRSNMIQKLSLIGMTTKGLSLAEKYRDMEALVILVQDLSTPELLEDAQHDDRKAQEQVGAIEKRVKNYFDKYGNEWANAFYTYQISRGAFTRLLDQASLYSNDLTRYLRAEQSRKKLSWINDVLSARDYLTASQSLVDVAELQESDLWSKKVELSIAKLARVTSEVQTDQPASQMDDCSAALELVKLQERLYEHIRHSFYDAVDQRAELQLAMDAFCLQAVKGRPALHQLLERGMESLINRAAMDINQLIDVLTLMDQRPSELKRSDIAGQEMFLALEALRVSKTSDSDTTNTLLLRVTYKRCFIRDDWRHLDTTARKSDQDAMDQLESTTLFKTFYEGHASGLWNSTNGIAKLSPSEVLGAGSTPDEHRSRFHAADLREPIAKDMATEDGILQHYLDKYRLAHWVTTAEEWAKERLRREAASKAEQGEKVRQVVTQLEGENQDFEKYKGRTSKPDVENGRAGTVVNGA